MKSRVVSGIMLTLLFMGILTLTFDIQPVKANATIFIRADGSVDPPEAPISSVDNVTYTLTADINGSVVVERDNIVVDGAGYTVQGTGAYNSIGIELSRRNNVTIRNVRVKAFWYGVYLYDSSNNTISGTVITDIDEIGIYLDFCFGNHVVENNVTNNAIGIMLNHSLDNDVSRNEVTNNWYGIGAWESSNYNAIHDNYLTKNLCAISLGHSANNNSIFGNVLFKNLRGIELCKCINNKVFRNNVTSNDGIGIYLYNSLSNIVFQNSIRNNLYGLKVSNSFNHSIYHNNILYNTYQAAAENSENRWDDGYPGGGNYWSDHVVVGNPSNGSQPYVIGANDIDHYPFQDPNGWLLPEMPGDVNDDGIVDIVDGVIIGVAFGSKPGDPNWNPIADIAPEGEPDNFIDIQDVVLWAIHFGE